MNIPFKTILLNITAIPTDTLPMFYLLLNLLRDLMRPNRDLLLENLALRQQILVLHRTNPKPVFSVWDKSFWVVLYRYWERWRRPLVPSVYSSALWLKELRC